MSSSPISRYSRASWLHPSVVAAWKEPTRRVCDSVALSQPPAKIESLIRLLTLGAHRLFHTPHAGIEPYRLVAYGVRAAPLAAPLGLRHLVVRRTLARQLALDEQHAASQVARGETGAAHILRGNRQARMFSSLQYTLMPLSMMNFPS